jgi:hypothetical protein
MKRDRQLDPDAPPVPPGLRPRAGVEYGCGEGDCGDCYEPTEEENPRHKGDDDGVEYADPRDYRDGRE